MTERQGGNRRTLDWRLVGACLSRLLPHLDVNRVALTGSAAIELGLAGGVEPTGRALIGDLDFVASSMSAVRPSVTRDLIVSHYHRPTPERAKFMIQLVDPVTHLRVDVFPDLADAIESAPVVPLGPHTLPVLPLAAILRHKQQTLASARPDRTVDPKHHDDVRRIAAHLKQEITPVDPRVLAPDCYGGWTDWICERCDPDAPDFPLAPRARVYELLGWPLPPILPS